MTWPQTIVCSSINNPFHHHYKFFLFEVLAILSLSSLSALNKVTSYLGIFQRRSTALPHQLFPGHDWIAVGEVYTAERNRKSSLSAFINAAKNSSVPFYISALIFLHFLLVCSFFLSFGGLHISFFFSSFTPSLWCFESLSSAIAFYKSVYLFEGILFWNGVPY